MMRGKSYMRKAAVLVAAAALLASCGGPGAKPDGAGVGKLLQRPDIPKPNPDKVTLRLWSFHTAKEFEFWQWLGEQYTKEHPNVEIKVEFISSDDYFSGNRLLSAFASGHGPDIFFVSPASIRRFEAANILQPLTEHFTPQIRDDFYATALNSVTIDGQIYAVPIETELLGLYYNKDMFQNRGLQPPKTWDDMRNAARALKSSDVTGLTMETFKSIYQAFNWLPFLWQTGADLVDEESSKSGLGRPGADRMYAYFRSLVDEGLLNLHPSRPTTDIGILASGETAMQVSGTWNIRLLETIYADRNIGVVPLPVPDEGGQPLTIAGGWKIAVNHFSPQAEEAAKFVMWAFAEQPSIPLKWVSEVKFAYSPRKSVMEAGGELYQRGLRKVFTEKVFGTERQEPQNAPAINNVFTDSLQRLLYGHTPTSDLVQDARRGIDTALNATVK